MNLRKLNEDLTKLLNEPINEISDSSDSDVDDVDDHYEYAEDDSTPLIYAEDGGDICIVTDLNHEQKLNELIPDTDISYKEVVKILKKNNIPFKYSCIVKVERDDVQVYGNTISEVKKNLKKEFAKEFVEDLEIDYDIYDWFEWDYSKRKQELILTFGCFSVEGYIEE